MARTIAPDEIDQYYPKERECVRSRGITHREILTRVRKSLRRKQSEAFVDLILVELVKLPTFLEIESGTIVREHKLICTEAFTDKGP